MPGRGHVVEMVVAVREVGTAPERPKAADAEHVRQRGRVARVGPRLRGRVVRRSRPRRPRAPLPDCALDRALLGRGEVVAARVGRVAVLPRLRLITRAPGATAHRIARASARGGIVPSARTTFATSSRAGGASPAMPAPLSAAAISPATNVPCPCVSVDRAATKLCAATMRPSSSGMVAVDARVDHRDAHREQLLAASKTSNAWSRARYHCRATSGSFGGDAARGGSRRAASGRAARRRRAGASRRPRTVRTVESPAREALARDDARPVGAGRQLELGLEGAVRGHVRASRRSSRCVAGLPLHLNRAPGSSGLTSPLTRVRSLEAVETGGRRHRRAHDGAARDRPRTRRKWVVTFGVSVAPTWPPRDLSARERLPLRRRTDAARASPAGSRARGRRGASPCRTRPRRPAASRRACRA